MSKIKVFQQVIVSNIPKTIIKINQIKIDNKNFFQKIFDKFILVSKVKRAKFLNLRYNKKISNFQNKKFKEGK